MIKLNSFTALFARPILEAALLEVQPKEYTRRGPDGNIINVTKNIAVNPQRNRGRQKKTSDDSYLFDIADNETEFWVSENVLKGLDKTGDTSQLKYIMAQSVLATLGLIDKIEFSKSKVITKSNAIKIAGTEKAFNSFVDKYHFVRSAPVDEFKRLFSISYDKNIINDRLGFNIFDLFKNTTWEKLRAVDKRTGLTKLASRILRIYAGQVGYDTKTREKYLDTIDKVVQSLDGYYRAKDSDWLKEHSKKSKGGTATEFLRGSDSDNDDSDSDAPVKTDEEMEREIAEKYNKARQILRPLLLLAPNIYVSKPSEEGQGTKEEVTPPQFDAFLTDVTRLSGWLRTVGIEKKLNDMESDDPSSTIEEYLTRINELLEEVLIPETKRGHITKIFAAEAAKNLRRFTRELDRLGYKGGITIENVLDYLKSDANDANEFTRISLNDKFGISPEELNTKTFPTFKSFVTALYRRGKHYMEWLNRRDLERGDQLEKPDRKGGLYQETKRYSQTLDSLNQQIEDLKKEIANPDETLEDTNTKWKDGQLEVTINVTAGAAFGRKLCAQYGIKPNTQAYNFGKHTINTLQKLFDSEDKDTLWINDATDEVKPIINDMLNSDAKKIFIRETRHRMMDKVKNGIGRAYSQQKNKRKKGEAEKSLTALIAKRDKISKRLGAIDIERYGYNRASSIDDGSDDNQYEDIDMSDVEPEIENERKEDGSFSFDINTRDAILLDNLLKSFEAILKKESNKFEINLTNPPISVEDVITKFNDGKISKFEKTRSINRTYQGTTITVTFPSDIEFFKNKDGRSVKLLNKYTKFLNTNANILAKALDELDYRAGIFKDLYGNVAAPIKVTLGGYYFENVTYTGSETITNTAQDQQNTPAEEYVYDGEEEEEITSITEAIESNQFFSEPVKYIANKDRYKRGYLVQEQRIQSFYS